MANAWLEHVKKFWAKNKGKMAYSKALQEARKTYKGKKASKDESKGMKGKKKGSKSKTHKGDKDFTTKKGDKDFDEKGKRIKKAKKPYKGQVKHGTK